MDETWRYAVLLRCCACASDHADHPPSLRKSGQDLGDSEEYKRRRIPSQLLACRVVVRSANAQRNRPAFASKAGFGAAVFVRRCAPNEDWRRGELNPRP